MENTTTTFTTPIGKKVVVIKNFITGREKRALVNVFLNGEVQFSADAKDIKGLKGGLVAIAEDLAIKTVVVSVGGSTEDVVKAVLDMHSQDYSFVVNEVNKVTSDQTGEEVKKN